MSKLPEKITKKLPETSLVESPENLRTALQKLNIQQVELEAQNEDLQQMKDELETSTVRYLDLYDQAPVGYCTINAKGLILEINLTASDMLGTPRPRLVNRPLVRFVCKEDQDTFSKHQRLLIEKSERQIFEVRMVKKRPDGLLGPSDGRPRAGR